LLDIQALNKNPNVVFCTKIYSYTNGTMKRNYNTIGDRGTFSDFQHVHASANQIKIGLFSTPVESWVRANKKDADGVAEYEKADWHAWVGVYRPHQPEGKRGSGKELMIWDSDWKDKEWKERVAGQQAWYDFWIGRKQWGKQPTRKMADIKVVWAGGDGNNGRRLCLRLSLEWMRKVAVGEVDLSGDMTEYHMQQVL
jgi:hypothetical protein